MLFKLVKRNQDCFFGKGLARVVEIGMMFTAAKRYQYAEIQEIASISGVAIRRVSPKDMIDLKEKDLFKFKHVKTNYWEKDASRLFIVISREEYLAGVREKVRRMSRG